LYRITNTPIPFVNAFRVNKLPLVSPFYFDAALFSIGSLTNISANVIFITEVLKYAEYQREIKIVLFCETLNETSMIEMWYLNETMSGKMNFEFSILN
jgi:hypothetical protein